MIARRAAIAMAMSAGLLLGGPLALARPPARPAPALSPAASPESVGFDSARVKKLDAAMAAAVADGRVAGMATLLARHGKVVEFNTYGKASLETGKPLTKDAIFRLASMSKPVTGVAMMILFEEGRWRLDDPVTRFIPEFKDLKVVARVNPDGALVLEDMKRPPTMREVMSHTAGFGYGLDPNHPVDKLFRERGVFAAKGLHQMIERAAGIPLVFQPGTDWRYSSAVDIQGYLVEKISGQTFGDFLAQRVFGPLKMVDTGFYAPGPKVDRVVSIYPYNTTTGRIDTAEITNGRSVRVPPDLESGGGGLLSTTTDYARFAQMLLNKGELEGVRILSPATVELMGTNVIPKSVLERPNAGSGLHFDENTGFGLDFQVKVHPRAAGLLEGDGTISWRGSTGVWFWIDPTNDLIFVGMIQRYGGIAQDDYDAQTRTLVYQALTHPEK